MGSMPMSNIAAYCVNGRGAEDDAVGEMREGETGQGRGGRVGVWQGRTELSSLEHNPRTEQINTVAA